VMVPARLCHSFAAIGAALFPTLVAAQPSCGIYQYAAEITEVYDGDSVTAEIDLGFNTWRRGEKLRLNGIDAPEVRGPSRAAGFAARDALASRIQGKQVTICTIKDKQEKFGRYLAEIYLGDELVNEWMVQSGFAKAYDGGRRVP